MRRTASVSSKSSAVGKRAGQVLGAGPLQEGCGSKGCGKQGMCAEEGASRSGDLGFGGQLGDQDTT